MNQMRALLLERGITVPKGRRKLEQHVAMILDSNEGLLSPRMRSLIAAMRAEWQALDGRIEAFADEFALRAKTDDAARRLATIPGIGVLNATALVAAIGNGHHFRAWARSCRLAGLGPASDDNRRQTAPAEDQ